MTRRIIHFLVPLLFCTVLNANEPEANSLLYHWVQIVPTHLSPINLAVRALMSGTHCPAVILNGVSTPMQVRAPKNDAFPITTCELAIPAGVNNATLLGKPLPLAAPAGAPVALFGDTGCLVEEKKQQNCENPNTWPFARIVNAAKTKNPGFIIHIGDYLYRLGSPYGNKWTSWEADFFGAAKPLLSEVPWLFIRGNHELCSAGGTTWFRFFDPWPYHETCLDRTPSYGVSFAGLQMVVVDSVSSVSAPGHKDEELNSDDIQNFYTQQFTNLNEFIIEHHWQHAWMISHVPLWGASTSESLSPALQHAFATSRLSGIELVLSGHIHFFQHLDFSVAPMQIVAGMSGTKLDAKKMPPELRGMQFNDHRRVTDGSTIGEFGYLLIENAANGKRKITFLGVGNTVLKELEL